MRVRVKVCGITRQEDAALACELGADALGFNFAPESPRRIEPARAAKIIEGLAPLVTPVAVVVNPDPQELARWLRQSGARVVQFHGEETPQACRASGYPWYKAFRVGEGFDPGAVEAYPGAWCLLDTRLEGVRGGTGRTFDWRLASEVGRRRRVILAGGLGPDNLAQAIECAAPAAVDLNSGVETAPGVKDAARLRAAFAALEEIRCR
ncbi:MAG: phosphoribosylanthranilate isomerase [Acidobacteriota bacterium]